MTLFEQLKNMPKIDLHINLTSSISTDLAFSVTNESSIQELEDKMIQKNIKDYLDSLQVPIEILRTKKNLELSIEDLIARLSKNNVVYGELFLDLPLYNKRLDEEKVLNIVLDTIKKHDFNLQVVLCLSSSNTKEENINTLNLVEKYYNKGVNGVYFKKTRMDNLSDYYYIFDRLKNNIPYILNVTSKVTNQDREIYCNSKRVIYSLSFIDEELMNLFRENNVMLELPISSLMESHVIGDLKEYFIYDLIKDNYLVNITSSDMTTLNTNILNEYCLLFNNCPVTLHDVIKLNINNLMNINLDNDKKNKLIEEYKDKCNLIF